MLNKVKLHFTYNLEKPLPLGLKNNELGRSNIKQLLYKDLFTKSLQKLRIHNKLELSQKIDYLINEFNKSKNIEIIQKSLFSKNFSNFIKNNHNDESSKDSFIRNVAFIARLNQNLQDDKNAIVLVFDFVKKKTRINGLEQSIFYLELVFIDVSFLQPLNYRHPNVFRVGGVELIKFSKADGEYDEKLSIEKQFNELEKLAGLKKAIDIFSDENDSLKLKQMRRFVIDYHKFLLEKEEDEKFNLYFTGKNEEKFLNLKNGEDFDVLIKTKKSNKIGALDQKREWIVSREDNYVDKIAVRIIDYKELNIDNEINEQIRLFETKIATNISELANIKQVAEESKSLLENIEKKIKKIELETYHIREEIESSEVKIAKYNSQLSELESKPKNKVTHSSSKIERVKQKKLEIIKNQSANNEMILNLKGQLFEKKDKLKKEEFEKQKIVASIIEFDSKSQKLQIDNQRNAEQIKKLEIQKENETSVENYYFKLRLWAFRKSSSQFKEEMKVQSFSKLDFILNKDCIVQMSNFDLGTFMIFKRWKATFHNYTDGFYKSPYALLSLNRPEVPIDIKSDVKIDSIKLNKLQQEAVNSIYFSHFSSFLQGPPGTGKTQVISAIVLNTIGNGENILISSSTNEAINNAFDRVFQDGRDPNLLMLRVSNSDEHRQNALKYSSSLLYKNFINKIGIFVNPPSSNLDYKNIDELKNTIATSPELAKNYLSPFPLSAKDVETLQEYEKNWLKEKFGYEDEDEGWTSYVANDFKHKRNTIKIKYKNIVEEVDNLIKRLDKIARFSFAYNLETYYQEIVKMKKAKSLENGFNKAIKKINNQVNEENKGYNFEQFAPEFQISSKKFAIECFKQQAINVIGITTTSSLKVGIDNYGDEMDLFTEYPIDVAVIDEISKSTTPEILSISQLAKKFIFAGDYRQLPPTIDFDEKSVLEFYDWCSKDPEKILDIERNEYYEHISSLFATSLFQNQVAKMKNKIDARKTSSYVALKKQYRFDENINELVNLTYQEDEKLLTHFTNDKLHFKKYKLGKKIKRENSIIAIDTSNLTSDFISNIEGKVGINNVNAFDSNYSLLSQMKYPSKINDFNAYVIKNVINNLHTNNPDLDFNHLGVITMTRSQANLIKCLLRKDKSLPREVLSAQINTIDNFQGREKDIIILDLVRAKSELVNENSKTNIITRSKRNVDFYKSPERINVSVSRAKNKLIIVGALEYLSKAIECKVKILGDEFRKEKMIPIFKDWSEIIAKQEGLLSWEEF